MIPLGLFLAFFALLASAQETQEGLPSVANDCNDWPYGTPRYCACHGHCSAWDWKCNRPVTDQFMLIVDGSGGTAERDWISHHTCNPGEWGCALCTATADWECNPERYNCASSSPSPSPTSSPTSSPSTSPTSSPSKVVYVKVTGDSSCIAEGYEDYSDATGGTAEGCREAAESVGYDFSSIDGVHAVPVQHDSKGEQRNCVACENMIYSGRPTLLFFDRQSRSVDPNQCDQSGEQTKFHICKVQESPAVPDEFELKENFNHCFSRLNVDSPCYWGECTLQSCADDCLNEPACTGFVYSTPNAGWCQLRNSQDVFEGDCGVDGQTQWNTYKKINSAAAVPDEFELKENFYHCFGQINVDSPCFWGECTLQSCADDCLNEPACTGFVYNSPIAGWCQLLNSQDVFEGDCGVDGQTQWNTYKKIHSADRDTAIRLSLDGSEVNVNVGEEVFNDRFAECAVLAYFRNGALHSIYKRITDIPDDFNAYNIFTDTWTDSPSNVLNIDFEIYSSLVDLENGANRWDYCNYNDPDVGFPRDCGPATSSHSEWFSMPGGVHNIRGITSGAELKFLDVCTTTAEPTNLPSLSPTIQCAEGFELKVGHPMNGRSCETDGITCITRPISAEECAEACSDPDCVAYSQDQDGFHGFCTLLYTRVFYQFGTLITGWGQRGGTFCEKKHTTIRPFDPEATFTTSEPGQNCAKACEAIEEECRADMLLLQNAEEVASWALAAGVTCTSIVERCDHGDSPLFNWRSQPVCTFCSNLDPQEWQNGRTLCRAFFASRKRICPCTSSSSAAPSYAPSLSPITSSPSMQPSIVPSSTPSKTPSMSPSSDAPSKTPSMSPSSDAPSKTPSMSPTSAEPTYAPSLSPITSSPSMQPSIVPSSTPSKTPSMSPTPAEYVMVVDVNSCEAAGMYTITTVSQCAAAVSALGFAENYGKDDVKTSDYYDRKDGCIWHSGAKEATVFSDSTRIEEPCNYQGYAGCLCAKSKYVMVVDASSCEAAGMNTITTTSQCALAVSALGFAANHGKDDVKTSDYYDRKNGCIWHSGAKEATVFSDSTRIEEPCNYQGYAGCLCARSGYEGSMCNVDDDCDSERCNFGEFPPRCREKETHSIECNRDGDCHSDHCLGRKCVDGRDNDRCDSSDDCQSGRCAFGIPFGKCQTPAEHGENCIRNNDCASEHCLLSSCTDHRDGSHCVNDDDCLEGSSCIWSKSGATCKKDHGCTWWNWNECSQQCTWFQKLTFTCY